MLGTKLIMVLGHNNCGAVNATLTALQKGRPPACRAAAAIAGGETGCARLAARRRAGRFCSRNSPGPIASKTLHIYGLAGKAILDPGALKLV
jgi:hypothetical protein